MASAGVGQEKVAEQGKDGHGQAFRGHKEVHAEYVYGDREQRQHGQRHEESRKKCDRAGEHDNLYK